jgi:hypothetical protein
VSTSTDYSARRVRFQHCSRRINHVLDHPNLALVELEIDNLPGFGSLAKPTGRRHIAGLGLMLLVFFATGLGCDGGSSSSSGGHTAGTPAGNYVIAVKATDGAVSHTANVAVTVQ